LNAYEEPPEFLDHYADVVHSLKASLSQPAINLTKIIHKTVSIWAKWKRYTASPAGTTSNIIDPVELLLEANELEVEFQAWEKGNLPATWKFQVFEISASTYGNYDPKWVDMILTSDGAPQAFHVYSNLKIAFGWNLFRIARLFLSRAMLEMIPALIASAPENLDLLSKLLDQTPIVRRVWRLTEDICASVLSHFTVLIPNKPDSGSALNVCGLRGYYLLWPLAVVGIILRTLRVPGMDAVKRLSWMKSILLYLQYDLGLAKAGAVVKATQFDVACSIEQ
jgi:hypothetical protein